jgi:hypothetical protein
LNMLRNWLDLGFCIAFGTKQVILEPLAHFLLSNFSVCLTD